MFVFNQDDNEFKVGDTVWIANTITHTDTCFESVVIQIVPAEVTGLGKHYVLYVPTHVDDRVDIREANRCFRSEEQYNEIKKAATKAEKEWRERIRKFRI